MPDSLDPKPATGGGLFSTIYARCSVDDTHAAHEAAHARQQRPGEPAPKLATADDGRMAARGAPPLDEKRLVEAWKARSAEARDTALAPQIERAAAALAGAYQRSEPEMNALLAELRADNLGAIDRAAALSRLSDLRDSMQHHLAALSGALA